MQKWFGVIALSLVSVCSIAADLTDSYNSLIYFTYGLVKQICVLTGVGLCLGALVQYRQYRQKASGVKLSMPVGLMIIGLLMIGLAYLPSNIKASLPQDSETAYIL